jgi:rhodanese-related sulfurtransferase
MKKAVYFNICVCVAALLLVLLKSSYAGDVSRITKEELKKKLCSTDLILLDARTVRSWDKSTQKINCSKRVDPDNISSWAGTLPKDQEIVLYCA